MLRFPVVVDADHNLHLLLDYFLSFEPMPEQTPSQRWSPRTQVHHEDAAATLSLLEQTGFQIYPQP